MYIRLKLFLLVILFNACGTPPKEDNAFLISKEELKDKIKGAWAMQTIGVTYGGPTEFKYLQQIIPDSIKIHWSDTMMLHHMKHRPGLYDDIYMDLTFVEVMEKHGIDAPAEKFANAYASANYFLWHANQQGRYNVLHGMKPPHTGHWQQNPHADDIDFQIEADFAGIMSPGMPNAAVAICDKVGHIMNYGDGYYGGVFVANLYSFAFINNNIQHIIEKANSVIPKESSFHQCIADVIDWYQQFPNDWKKTWQLVEDKWGNDIGCPDGAAVPFNIDAKINAAYVVMGLLYGQGDIYKTLEVSTRCGQDSDCNPATAGAILGVIMGYDNIPEKWSAGLKHIEDMNFLHTEISLNKTYEVSYKHALQMVENNGGEISGDGIRINLQEPAIVPLEQNFNNLRLLSRNTIDHQMNLGTETEYQASFTGSGVVLTGKAGNLQFRDKYMLLSPEETLDNYIVKAEILIDDSLKKVQELPLDFITRSHELYFDYHLEEGDHKLKITILNPQPEAYLWIEDIIMYTKNSN